MERQTLLETNLKQLKLPTFAQNYRRFAEDAVQAHQSYEAFLLALTEQELAQREANRQRLCIKAARFPVLKEFADFDFSYVPALNKQQVLDLARGDYIAKAEPILLVGNPGLGKTHIALSLALAACRQSRRVRFYSSAGLVNDLIEAQDEHRLPGQHTCHKPPFVPCHGRGRPVWDLRNRQDGGVHNRIGQATQA